MSHVQVLATACEHCNPPRVLQLQSDRVEHSASTCKLGTPGLAAARTAAGVLQGPSGWRSQQGQQPVPALLLAGLHRPAAPHWLCLGERRQAGTRSASGTTLALLVRLAGRRWPAAVPAPACSRTEVRVHVDQSRLMARQAVMQCSLEATVADSHTGLLAGKAGSRVYACLLACCMSAGCTAPEGPRHAAAGGLRS